MTTRSLEKDTTGYTSPKDVFQPRHLPRSTDIPNDIRRTTKDVPQKHLNDKPLGEDAKIPKNIPGGKARGQVPMEPSLGFCWHLRFCVARNRSWMNKVNLLFKHHVGFLGLSRGVRQHSQVPDLLLIFHQGAMQSGFPLFEATSFSEPTRVKVCANKPKGGAQKKLLFK